MSAALHAVPSVRDKVSKEEWQIRTDLAATYRLVAHHGWSDMIFTHISARIPGPEHHFLINPYGMTFDEITASSLVKIDVDGNKVMDSPHPVNPAGFTIHSAIHMAREDAQAVIHVHTADGVAVSCQAHGLLPISQHAMLVHADVAYHDYEGVALNHDERPRLVNDLGTKNIFILRNHGTLTVGQTCADAFLRLYNLERACTIQVKALAGGTKINQPNDGVPDVVTGQVTGMNSSSAFADKLVWPAMLRLLDRKDPSYRN
jgi:ribulose-5-phosphate 4-epimerase/fuculose-1-phosphate aldolase